MKNPQGPDSPHPIEGEKFIVMDSLENGSSREIKSDTSSMMQSFHNANYESYIGSISGALQLHNSNNDEQEAGTSMDTTRFTPFSVYGVTKNDMTKIMSNWQQTANMSDSDISSRCKWLRSSTESELHLNRYDDGPFFCKEDEVKKCKVSNQNPFREKEKILSETSLYSSIPDDLMAVRSVEKERRDSNLSCSQRTLQRVIFCVHGKPSSCCATQIHTPSSDTDLPPHTITIDTEEHCHQRREEEHSHKKARKKLIIASVLCLCFMLLEMIGGIFSNSLAIATDAAHLLTDFASFMISLFSIWVSDRKPTRVFLFGWHRAEVLGALVSVFSIWVVTALLVYIAAQRIITKSYEIETEFMLITSVFGVLVNLVMGCALHQHGHHSHAKNKTSTTEQNQTVTTEDKPRENINVRAAFIHVAGDFIQSTGVFIAALLIYFNGPSWYIVDPICTFFFSILVLCTTIFILKDTFLVLMEGMPKGVEYEEVLKTLLSIEHVVRVHNLRIWALSLDKTALAAHIVISLDISTEEVLRIASKKIHEKYNFFEMTLQIEYFQEGMEECQQCQDS